MPADDIQGLAYRLVEPLRAWFMTPQATLDYGRGTAFPLAPAAGTRFFRTDLGYLCYYDGTRWLTTHEYVVPFQTVHTTVSAIGTTLVGEVTFRQDYAPYFTRHTTEHVVAGTNNGANLWTFTYRTMTTGNTVGSTLVTWNTGADGAAVTFRDGTTATTAASYGSVQLIVATTGAPGAVTINGAVLYSRLIVT